MKIELQFEKPCQITRYLNENCKGKQSKKPYNDQDVEGYMHRGWLPKALGNIRVQEKRHFDNRIIYIKGELIN